MRQQVVSTLTVYIFLFVSIVANILYFVYSTHDGAKSWTEYGFVPAMCFTMVVLGAVLAFKAETSGQNETIRRHASEQINIIFVLVVGGILSAIQTSAQWLLESESLAGILNIALN